MRFFLINVDFFIKKLRFLRVLVIKVVVFIEVFVPISVLEEIWSKETSLDHVWKQNLSLLSCFCTFTRKFWSVLLVYAKNPHFTLKVKQKTLFLRVSEFLRLSFTQKWSVTQKFLRLSEVYAEVYAEDLLSTSLTWISLWITSTWDILLTWISVKDLV